MGLQHNQDHATLQKRTPNYKIKDVVIFVKTEMLFVGKMRLRVSQRIPA